MYPKIVFKNGKKMFIILENTVKFDSFNMYNVQASEISYKYILINISKHYKKKEVNYQ